MAAEVAVVEEVICSKGVFAAMDISRASRVPVAAPFTGTTDHTYDSVFLGHL